ncbi:MAG: secretin and TonB N-terminal domain-containing protein [bacterium]|nr:secretin and TonB N-terminal domain-containing protein [bacterium]
MNVCSRMTLVAVAQQRLRAAWHGGLAGLLLLAPLVQAQTALERVRERTQSYDAAERETDSAVPQRAPSVPGVSMATRIDFTPEQERTMPVSQRIAIEQLTNDTAVISLNYKNGDLQNILRLIARVSGVNLVAGPEVHGTVTIELHDVHWERALTLILTANGYTYVRDGNILRVVSADQVEKEPLSIIIIPVNYAKANELLPVLTPLLTGTRGKIESDERVNALIITDIPAKLGQIEKVVQRLDQPTPQVLIEAKFIEITVGDVNSEGVDWSNLGDYGVVLHDMLYTFDREVTLARSGSGEGDFYGFPIPSGLPANKARSYGINQTQATTYQLEPDQFRLAFSMLLNNSRAKLISNPKIQTLDNKRATIRVAETRYKPKFTFNKETGSYEINELEDIYVGITLEVTPHVNYNGDVTLDIIPEVSDLTGNQVIQGVEVPITNIRRVETRVSLRDRYTVAVGGIIKDNWVTSKRSIPYLCEMPYLGPYLFTWETKDMKTVNLVIFITPTILRTNNTDPRWQPQLEQMHVGREGEWRDVITNTPSMALLRMREQLLITAATNQIGGFDVTTMPRTP